MTSTWTTFYGGNERDYINTCSVYEDNVNQKYHLFVAGVSGSSSQFPLDNGGGTPYYDGVLTSGHKGIVGEFDISKFVISVDELFNSNNQYIFPNPAKDYLYFSEQIEKSVNYKISNLLGSIVKKGSLSGLKPNINIESINTGMYFLVLEKDKNRRVFKFIKE